MSDREWGYKSVYKLGQLNIQVHTGEVVAFFCGSTETFSSVFFLILRLAEPPSG